MTLEPSGSEPAIFWVPAEQNPWKVPILDVQALTQTLASTSPDAISAQNAGSYGREEGTCFSGQEPLVPRSIPSLLQYRRDRLLAEGVLFNPSQMEHKWA